MGKSQRSGALPLCLVQGHRAPGQNDYLHSVIGRVLHDGKSLTSVLSAHSMNMDMLNERHRPRENKEWGELKICLLSFSERTACVLRDVETG